MTRGKLNVRLCDLIIGETAMRKSLILALLASPATAEDRLPPVYVAAYEILSDHADCSGPGKVAFRATSKQQVVAEYFPATVGYEKMDNVELPVCTIKTRKGDTTVETPVACPGEDQQLKDLRTQVEAFCEMVDRFPVKPTLETELTACLSVEGLKVLESSWSMSSDTTFGAYAVSGTFEKYPAQLRYSPSYPAQRTLDYAVVATGTETTPAHLSLRAVSEGFRLQELPDLNLGVAATLDLYLLDQSRQQCLKDVKSCFAVVEPQYNAEIGTMIKGLGEALSKTMLEPVPSWEIVDYERFCDDT
jgi:hypothetical protein